MNDIKLSAKKNKVLLKYLALQKPYYLNSNTGILVSTLLAYYYASDLSALILDFLQINKGNKVEQSYVALSLVIRFVFPTFLAEPTWSGP